LAEIFNDHKDSDFIGISEKINEIFYEVRKVIVGQQNMIEKIMVAILADGHLLLEGAPGLAKTLTLKTFAQIINADFKRIQFTPDLLPADLTGTRIFNINECKFSTELGPIFSNLILADEINRAPAKVQSALLEAMQEKQITIGKQTFRLNEPFMVMATQNPIEQEGTYSLPEAQLDRFMLKILVDYPDEKEEISFLERIVNGTKTEIRQILDCESIINLRKIVEDVYIDPKIIHYIVEIVSLTRTPQKNNNLCEIKPYIQYGSSPRGSLALTKAAKAYALIKGRKYVIPEDIICLAKECLRHRIILSYQGLAQNITQDQIIEKILTSIKPPYNFKKENSE